MAKDLPYFKFFCSEWNDGDITLEDFKIQGLFINVCSYYWSNECYLEIDKLKKRFKHNKEDVEYLLTNGLLHNEGGFLAIHFLDEQQEERKEKSKQSSKAGKASAERRKLAKLEKDSNTNPTPVEIPLNGNPTIKRREEEKREEKKRKEKEKEEYTKALPFSFYNSLILLGGDKQLVSDWLKVRKNKKATNSETAFNGFKKQLEKTGVNINKVLELCVIKSWAGFNSEWYKNEVKPKIKLPTDNLTF